jgi:hypothetical protein
MAARRAMLDLPSMRTDILPLCDKHYRTMEAQIAPYMADYSIEFFRCTEKFCQRCFAERLGYCTPVRSEAPVVLENQPRCERHGRPMCIASFDRPRNLARYGCMEPGCGETITRDVLKG